MKPSKASNKSPKFAIKIASSDSVSGVNRKYSETIIPIGSNDLEVILPPLRDTFGGNLINTDKMTGAITLKTSGGASLKGLTLNHIGGALSITPVPQGTTSFEMGSDVKDGCFIQTLSNGNNWFIWSVATHGTLGIGQAGNNNVATPSATVTQIPAPVTLNPIQTNTTFPPEANFEARHSIIISGDAEPGATIVISEEAGLVDDIIVVVGEDGTWSTNEITDLENADYNFTFTPSVGEPATDQEFTSNDGVLSFTTPSCFIVERGEAYDFSIGASAIDTSNVAITPFNIDNSQYNTGLAHGATFDIVYSFTHNGTPYTRTVSGVVEDTTAPAKPTIASATFDAVNINDFTATGNAEDGSTVEIFFDGASQGTVTATGGTWTFTKTFTFLQTFNITAQATDAQNNVSEESDPTSVVYSPPTLARPTLAIDNAPANTWSNQANPIQISGTTDAGSTIVIKSGNQTVTPQSGPTYVGADWSATINVADESNSSLTVEASQASFNSPSPSITKTLLIDRVAPVISGTPLGALTVYLGNIGTNNDSIPAATDFSSTTVTSDWTTQVDATEGAKTVTYTATDAASNSATTTRTVNVSTEVIIPVITDVVDNGDGTATITGTVTGTYANNLDVQIVVDGSNNGSPFDVTGGTFTVTITLAAGSYQIQAKTVNSASESSTLTTVETLVMAEEDVTAPVITVVDGGGTTLVALQVVETIVNGGFAFTASTDDGSTVITTGNSYDNTTIGTYTIYFNSTDDAGNSAAEVQITINVNAQSLFIEDLASVISRVENGGIDTTSGIYTDNSHGGSTGMTVLLNDDGILQYDSTTNETVNDEFTISWWMNLNSSQAASNLGLAGINVGQINGVVRRFAFDLGGGSSLTNPHFASHTRGPKTTNNLNTGVSMAGVWTHVAIVIKNDSSNTVASLYLNGNKLPNSISEPLGTKFFPPSSHQVFKFGAGFQSKSVKGQFDSMQIADGTALTDNQVTAIYNQSDRLMTIAAAAALPNASAAFIEDNAGALAVTADGDLFDDSGNIIFRNFPTGATTAGYAQGDWSDYVTYSGGSFSYTSMTISLWFNPKEHFTSNNLTTMRLFSSRETSGTDGVQLLVKRSSTNFYTIQLSYYYNGAWRTKNLNGNSGESAASFTIDSWRHIVAVFDGSDILVFLDGVYSAGVAGFSVSSQLTESLIGSPNDSSATFTLGASNDGSNTVDKNVYIDSVEITENLTIDASQATTLFADSTRQTSIRDV